MTNYFNYNDCLKVIWRDGSIDDPYIPIEDVQKIVNNTIILSEIPDEFNHVQIENYAEVYQGQPESNQFIVNYTNGIVTFNSSEENETVTAQYFGRGQILISANRVYIHNDNPDIVTTLQDIADNIKLESSTAPITGTWEVGQIVYNSTPTAGGYIGWVCVTAGAPGTWKTFGAITS